MTGWDTLQRIRRVEYTANLLGFQLDQNSWGRNNNIDLCPRDDALPGYNRDATIFSGSLEDIENWLAGIQWAQQYDQQIGLKTAERRLRAEQRIRNKLLVDAIKGKDI